MSDTGRPLGTLADRIAEAGGSLADLYGSADPLRGVGVAVSVNGLASGLLELGVKRGQVVAWPAANSTESILCELACMRLGAVAAPLPGHNVGAFGPVHHRLNLQELPRRGTAALPPPARLAEGDPVAWKFTSGTAARSRAVAATSAHHIHMAQGIEQLFDPGPGDTLLAMLPGSVWLQRLLVQIVLGRGGRVCLLSRPEMLARALGRVRPSIVQAVPDVLTTMLALAQETGRPLGELWGGRLRSLWTGSAPLSDRVRDSYHAADVPLHEGYGTTETGMIAKNAPGRSRRGSVGRVFPGVSVELRDGEVVVRSDSLANTRYADGSSGRWLDERTYATGDLAQLDPDGYLCLEGRIDDMIALASGVKVSPAMVESALLGSEMIVDCAVVGNGRPWLVALVVLSRPASHSSLHAQLRVQCNSLPVQARVRAAVPVSSLKCVRTPLGKLDRSRLLSTFRDEIDALYADV